MCKKITDRSCTEFVSTLASSAPTPGGGSAAALVGAVGAALGSMVGSLTIGKKKYSAVQEEVASLKDQADELWQRLLNLVEKDSLVFAPLAEAYRLPADTESQRKEKQETMEKLLRNAAQAPLEIMEACVEALSIIDRISQIGSKMAISDAGCAAACLQASIQSASLNVWINIKSMRDSEYARKLGDKTEILLSEGTKRAGKIFDFVQEQLKSGGG